MASPNDKGGGKSSKYVRYRDEGRRAQNKERRIQKDERRGRRFRTLEAVARAHELIEAGTVRLADGSEGRAESMLVAQDGTVQVVVTAEAESARQSIPVRDLVIA